MTDADDGENMFGSDDDEDAIGIGMNSKVEVQTTNNVTNIFGSDDEDEVDEKWGRLQTKGDASPEEAANSNNNDNDKNDEGGGDLFGSDDEEDDVTSKDKKMPSRDDIMNYIVEVDEENQNDTKDWTIRQFLKALSGKVGFDLSEDKDIKSRVKDVINYFHDHRDKIMIKRSQGNTTGWLSADDDDDDDDGLGVKGESYESGYKDHYFKVKKKEKTISYLRLPQHNQILNTTSNSNTNSKLSYSKLPRDIKIQPSAFDKGKYDLQSELSRFDVLRPHQSLGTCILIHTRTYSYSYTYIHAYSYTLIHTHTHSYTLIHTCIPIHKYMYAKYVHIPPTIYTNTYIYIIYIYIYVCVCVCVCR